jgi:hypothetical protein
MYCEGCGAAFNPGSQFCTSCGRELKGTRTATAPPNAPAAAMPARVPAPAAPVSDTTRVRRHISLLGGLWLANGILRLIEVLGFLAFRRMIFDNGWGWNWPFGDHGPGFGSLFWGSVFAGGVFFAVFGAIHVLLAWGLFERQPWARVLGIVVACLALLRIPFGTALGIYTLWVLLPVKSGEEYDAMAGGQVSAAR